MNAVDATDALEMLARFHAKWWRGLPDSPPLPPEFWPLGGYWTLDKRAADLDRIESHFEALCEAFRDDDPDGLVAACRIGELGRNLRRFAHALHRLTSSSSSETVVHGDFKAANIIRDVASGAMKMIDFQWCGLGSPARDLAYYFCTSASEEVLVEKESLLHTSAGVKGEVNLEDLLDSPGAKKGTLTYVKGAGVLRCVGTLDGAPRASDIICSAVSD